jgi:hypothetical protein
MHDPDGIHKVRAVNDNLFHRDKLAYFLKNVKIKKKTCIFKVVIPCAVLSGAQFTSQSEKTLICNCSA